MEWVPEDGWFTHLVLETEAANVVYDLSVGVDGLAPSFVDAGFTRFEPNLKHLEAMGLEPVSGVGGDIASLMIAGVLGGLVAGVMVRRRQSADLSD